jgi:hypothetical protein
MAWDRARWKAVVLDFGERAGWSAGQVFFATLLTGGAAVAVGDLPWKYSLTLAGSAAVASVVLTAIQYLSKKTDLPFWADLLVRAAKTFLGSLGASILAEKVFDVTTFHWTAALNLAAVATIAAIGKGYLASSQPATASGGTTAAGQPAVPTQRTGPSTLTTGTYLRAIR